MEEWWFNTKASSLNGEANGLDILLDVEQFNYAFRQANAAGFRISLHGHNVKPVMQFSSQLIYPGTESMINVKPTISYTTKNAISTFSPNERGCYIDDEIELNFLTKKFHGLGYR